MDPLTAFSLAGNVIQFVDFSTKLLLTGRELYRSASGALQPYEELELVTTDLVAICDKLHHEEELGPEFERVCREAKEIAHELLRRLNRLKVTKGQGMQSPKKWETLQQAFAIAWSKNDVEGLVARLTKIKGAIEMRILSSLRYSLHFPPRRTIHH
jgi:hypothetical protein